MKFLLVLLLIVTVIIVGISIYLQPNDFMRCESVPSEGGDCRAADAIVVVSGGDTASRTAQGIELYKNGWARTIIFSGAAQDKTGPSNAATMRQIALDAGVPPVAILTEELSESTQENAVNTKTIFEQNGYERVILVTSGYHQRRASMEFERRTPEVAILNYPLMSDDDWSAWWWATPRGWWLAGGELVKIVVISVEGAVS